MWDPIKQWFTSGGRNTPQPPQTTEYTFRWYEPGAENPFGIRVLDVRSLTWAVTATTSDQRIAESYMTQRRTNGREFVNAPVEDAASVTCHLTFPHNGEPLEGIVFKADCMEIKWDIYFYDSVFLFVRSWTGQLQYRAAAEISQDKITIRSIEASRSVLDTAPQAVKFLLATHAMGQVLPHTIPADTPNDPRTIALTSFRMFGKLACYATYADITTIGIPRPIAGD